MKTLKESIIEDGDADIKKKELSEDSHDADVEEKKSITEEDSTVFVAEKLAMATEPPPLSCNEK